MTYMNPLDNKEVLVKITKYCAYQDRCKKEVYNKLDTILPDITQQDIIIDYLIKEKYLDEDRYVQSIVRGKFFHKNWGKIKIRHFLHQKNISTFTIEETIAREIKDKDYRTKAYELVASKWKTTQGQNDFEIKQKILSSLYQKGYKSELILDVLHDFINDLT